MAGCGCKRKKVLQKEPDERIVQHEKPFACVPENLCGDDGGEAYMKAVEDEIKEKKGCCGGEKSTKKTTGCGCRKKKS